MADTGKIKKWLLPAIGAVLSIIGGTGLVTYVLETGGEPWLALAIALAGVMLTTVLVLKTDKTRY